VRRLFEYTKLYAGSDPELIDGDVFRVIVPLDDESFYDALTIDDVVENEI